MAEGNVGRALGIHMNAAETSDRPMKLGMSWVDVHPELPPEHMFDTQEVQFIRQKA